MNYFSGEMPHFAFKIKILPVVLATTVFFCLTAHSQNLDQIGVTLLRAQTTNLNGSGVRVAQPEASFDQGTNWEVNPGATGQPVALFTYASANGTANYFPNSISSESGHAGSVGANFYGLNGGVAMNVAHVDNYDADFFYTNFIDTATLLQPSLNCAVVNQSFTFGNVSAQTPTPPDNISVSDEQQVDSSYDNYAAQHGTLFVSAVNNSGSVSPPGTGYNCIGVAAYGGASSIGPTVDNGRCKPDITAPAGVTSFSTPQVAGAAAVLIQAALRGDGGGDTNSAADLRTIKSLLLNGAVKPTDWANSNSSPLDARYGAGVLNVFNAYEELAGGKRGAIITTTAGTGGAHPPTGAAGTIPVLSGWDFNTNTSSILNDAVKHYYFNVINNSGGSTFTATATLVWNRQQNQTAINNLSLFLYNCANSNLVTCSTSAVDNVEHFFVPSLAPGRYDLQVWKAGGLNTVSAAETYALAFAFVSPPLAIANSGTSVALSWPAYPAGFTVAATTNLASPVTWSANNLPAASVVNGQNYLLLSPTNAAQFFRLRQPNF